jgi:NADH dehydrogenase FAD-containing subunit
VRFEQGRAAGFEGDPFAALLLEGGGRVEGELCVVAVGISPATGGIEGLSVDRDGGLSTGSDLSVPGLSGAFAAGDCARPPTPWGRVRVEHWRVARQHGARAAAGMLRRPPEGADVPFFWTALGRQYRYLGHAEEWDEIAFDGAPEDGPFLARYLKHGRVMAMLGAGRDAEIAEAHLAMRAEGGPLAA